ncbi:MerR family DNA-binding protein [Arenimonas sp.]|jgi:DNA-binding transcriptional MerR regulator|uniref:MerR family DNA-binding protein n=1 Tax=Arenimonas sp. TaxID=1872635 RepID=UPI0025B81E4F|nr:MerR family DNA-binding protein [Arenimonas sp.]
MTAHLHKTEPPMTVRRLAKSGGVTVHVVRNYLRRGLLRAARHTEAGYQLFSTAELHRLHFIRTAQRLGFTLTEIEEILRRSRQRRSPCPLVRDIISRRLAETRDQLEQLLALQTRMAQAVAQWSRLPDAVPTGNDVCALIEAVAASEAAVVPKSTPRRLLGGRNASEETAS